LGGWQSGGSCASWGGGIANSAEHLIRRYDEQDYRFVSKIRVGITCYIAGIINKTTKKLFFFCFQ